MTWGKGDGDIATQRRKREDIEEKKVTWFVPENAL